MGNNLLKRQWSDAVAIEYMAGLPRQKFLSNAEIIQSYILQTRLLRISYHEIHISLTIFLTLAIEHWTKAAVLRITPTSQQIY